MFLNCFSKNTNLKIGAETDSFLPGLTKTVKIEGALSGCRVNNCLTYRSDK
ncbi:hypothetical protein CHISP_3435 [Chitinispirillum alkaliphilum]|nr:hypothetical protein CHISP_3435 [Chitinispirillum alkaliphilum]